VLPFDVKFLAGRNVRLGRPELYVKSSGRLLAIGGSRKYPAAAVYPAVAPVNSFKVVKVPKLWRKPSDDFHLFQVTSSLKTILAFFLTFSAELGWG
jgi:hypothetical protein